MQMIDLDRNNKKHIKQVANLWLDCFDSSWNTPTEAVKEVMEWI